MSTLSSFFVYGSDHACRLLRELNASGIPCGPDIEYGRAIGFYALAAAGVLGLGVTITLALFKGRSRSKLPKKETPSSKGPR